MALWTFWRLSRKLKSPRPDERASAARLLGGLGDLRAVDMLMEALSDEQSQVRQAASESLAHLGQKAVRVLMNGLETGDEARRRSIIAILAKMGGDAVDPLLGLLPHKDQSLRRLAVWALGQIGDLRTVQPLLDALKDWDPDVRTAVVHALARMLKPAVDPLIGLLGDWNCQVRAAAAEALGEIKDPRAIEPLVGVLSDKEANVRDASAEALARIGGDAVARALVAMVTSPRLETQQVATRTLIRLGDPAVEPLARALEAQADPHWRAVLIELFGEIGKRRAVEHLVGALRDADMDVRQVAARTLVKLGWKPGSALQRAMLAVAAQQWEDAIAAGPVGAEVLMPLLSDVHRHIRVASLRVLGKIQAQAAVPTIIPLLGDSFPDVACAAAEALGDLRATSAVEVLIGVMQNPELGEAAADALGRIGDGRAGPALALALKACSPPMGPVIQRALCRLGAMSVEPLASILPEGTVELRRLVAETLVTIGGAEAVAVLRTLREDADADVQQIAADAIARLEPS